MERDPVASDHVRISLEQVLAKALADVFIARCACGRGAMAWLLVDWPASHKPARAGDATEAIMADFARVDWRVTMPRRRQVGGP